MTVGHNRWHEKIVCCLDMLILWPYINWRVWSTLDTLIHITSLGTMTTTSNIHHRYISSALLDPPWDLSFKFNVVLTGLNSKYLCTRGKWLTAMLRSSVGMSSVWANELLMGRVCLAPGDRRETGDCPRHGHQWTHDDGWHGPSVTKLSTLSWASCIESDDLLSARSLLTQCSAAHYGEFWSPFRWLKLR